jgi:hypothetical protein
MIVRVGFSNQRGTSNIMKIFIGFAVAAVLAAGFLGYTSPGQRVLASLGFATACPNNNC